ncbi:hypothetical protein [Boudabousia marimammalium]|uniref:Uncharacterized protein n=1 Tax=Boudabousia marimammalium TaxID=156892 RepID=A0A1Q5PS59_9ACTO|nr:hypothetical protein [Boudabousia marimammalium]OKL50411.1 hypothetical protein BM477_00050 [Boudabousia marimammalium]
MQNRPYHPNYEWIWSGLPETTVASLQLTVTHPQEDVLAAAVADFLAGLFVDSNGVHGLGGWAVYPMTRLSSPHRHIFNLVSGGEDAADSLVSGADWAFAHFSNIAGIHLYWKELPSLPPPTLPPR